MEKLVLASLCLGLIGFSVCSIMQFCKWIFKSKKSNAELIKKYDSGYSDMFLTLSEAMEEKKWYYNIDSKTYKKSTIQEYHCKEITNKEFIKQLEENAR